MRVALLTREFPPNVYGGAGVHVGELARELREMVDLEIHCFAGDLPTPAATATYAPWTEPERLCAGDPLGTALGVMSVDLAMTAALRAVDLCHSHTWYANLAGHLAKSALGAAHVATVHSLEPLRPWKAEQLGAGYALSSWCEKVALEGADRIIAVSRAMADDLHACYPAIPPERISVIHNGVNVDTWSPDAATDVLVAHGIDPDRPIVLFVGRITRQKGLSALLGAARSIDARAQLVICAGAPDSAAIAHEVETLMAGAAERAGGLVRIDTMLDPASVAQLQSHATVFVCPSIYEPFGLVNVEAMACGAAVVASAVGGIPEIVVDGETGILVPVELADDGQPRDARAFSAALADAINALVADPERARALGRAGRRRVEEHFSWPAIARQTLATYQAALAGDAP